MSSARQISHGTGCDGAAFWLQAYSALSGSASRDKSVPGSKEWTKKPFGRNAAGLKQVEASQGQRAFFIPLPSKSEVHLAEALKIFAASVGLSSFGCGNASGTTPYIEHYLSTKRCCNLLAKACYRRAFFDSE